MSKLTDMADSMEAGFADISSSIEKLDDRFDELDGRIEALNNLRIEALEQLDARIEGVEGSVEELGASVDRVTVRVEQRVVALGLLVERVLDVLETRDL